MRIEISSDWSGLAIHLNPALAARAATGCFDLRLGSNGISFLASNLVTVGVPRQRG
jgi:hypothetical protein